MENLFAAWKEFRRGKKSRRDVQQFEVNLEDNIFDLYYTLKSGEYRHGGYASFYVNDPKRRHIHKALVRDRLLHHAVHRIIEPIWDKAFIFDSWSSRKNKGIHKAVDRLQKLCLCISHNYTKTLWILKLDIAKFFASINHKILLNILAKKFSDKQLINLFQKIISSFETGLPLGNLTSQLFANAYLNELDKFIKNDLIVKGYTRYADDFVLANANKSLLTENLIKIQIFLHQQLRLKIHPKKIILKTYASGIDFLGYVCFPHYAVLRTKTKRRMFNRANEKNFTSYCGLLSHCRSYNLRKLLLERIQKQADLTH